MTYSDEEIRTITAFRKLDDIERLIFMRGLKALTADTITNDQFEARVRALFDRHRAGEKLTISDLNSIEDREASAEVGKADSAA